MAKFYSRVQRENETPTEFAISLEVTLREVEEMRRRRGQSGFEEENRDRTLATQFMSGLKDLRYRQRLAPMQPRSMTFRDIRRELHIIAEEERQAEEIRRRRAPFFAMNELAQCLPQQTSEGRPQKQSAAMKEPETPTPAPSVITPAFQQLLFKQMEEMKVMCQEQVTAMGRLLNAQQQHGQRLMRLEAAVFPSQIPSQPRQKTPFTGCFNCGDMRHLTRNCPEDRRAPPHAKYLGQNDQQVRVQVQAVPSSPAQPQTHKMTAEAPLNEQNLRM